MMTERALLIAGPTASGKSKLALDIAAAVDGVIINADSMQLYRELRILTARPNVEDEVRIAHRLYGIIGADTEYSVADWERAASHVIKETWADGRLPILVGGTGLYFEAVLNGLAPVPEIDPDIRKSVRRRAETVGSEGLHAELRTLDPQMADTLSPGDRQRICRALEVVLATGRSLAEWQKRRRPGALTGAEQSGNVLKYVVAPPRQEVYRRIDARFDDMIKDGALDEVQRLIDAGIDLERPAMKALGIPLLRRTLSGDLPLADAVEQTKAQTRRYAKRQFTWYRNRFYNWQFVTGHSSVEKMINSAKKLAKTG